MLRDQSGRKDSKNFMMRRPTTRKVKRSYVPGRGLGSTKVGEGLSGSEG